MNIGTSMLTLFLEDGEIKIITREELVEEGTNYRHFN